MIINRTYSELISIKEYESRFNYLKLEGKVGEDLFGHDRWLNQIFYTSKEWKEFRKKIVLRDYGCDMAHEEHPIIGRIYVHHLNPIGLSDIQNRNYKVLLNPENVVCVSFETHQAITFGIEDLIPKPLIERAPGDTCPWRIKNGAMES